MMPNIRVGVTGATSQIGKLTISSLSQKGYSSVAISSRESSGNWKTYVLGHTNDFHQFDELDVIVHLAWDWSVYGDEAWRVNVLGSIALLEYCVKNQIKFVFLSTFSAFSKETSEYGNQKDFIEQSVLSAGGIVIRSGLIWGTQGNSGMLGTLRKISSLTLNAFTLRPDPPIYISEAHWLAETIANFDSLPQGKIILAADASPIYLSQIMRYLAKFDFGISIPLNVSRLINISEKIQRLGIKIPFRPDSLRSLLVNYEQIINTNIANFIPNAPNLNHFKQWALEEQDSPTS